MAATTATNQADKPKIQELEKFGLFTPAPGADFKRSRLAWCIRDGNPRITVYTNVPEDKTNYGIIPAPMNPETFGIFLDLWEQIVKSDVADRKKVQCFTAQRTADGKPGEKILLSEVLFGRDNEGIVYIIVKAADDARPKIKFDVKLSEYHKIFKGDGTPLTEKEGSTLQALAMINTLRSTYERLTGGLRAPNENSGKGGFSKGGFGGKKDSSFPAKSNDAQSVVESAFDDISF